MDYVQNTPDDTASMLQGIGVRDIDSLFAQVPAALRLNRPLDLPPALPESLLAAHLESLASRNWAFEPRRCFLGAGSYGHFIPAVVGALSSRGEFVTSYTPYQAEASQGTLQHIFEFQSMICELTGLDVSNASHYDGATALQEAVAMAMDHTGRSKVLLSAAINPQGRAVVRTLSRARGARILEVAQVRGATPVATIREACRDAACVVLQNPNFFGCLEDLDGAAEAAREAGAVPVASVNPLSLGLLKPPGECGFDIAVGDAQPLGMEMSFGGPGCGFIAARRSFLRRIPGRIVGQTADAEGRRGFVLTLQTREQHIRREKAFSNICTNQALMALRASIYLAAVGPSGLRRAAELGVRRAHELADRLQRIPGVKFPFPLPFFNEFVVEVPHAEAVSRRLVERGFLPGLVLQPYVQGLRNHLLVCCTEQHSAEDLEAFASALEEGVKWAARDRVPPLPVSGQE